MINHTVAINDTWRVLVGYFLIDGITAEQKKTFVVKFIQIALQSIIQMVNLTFDDTTTYIAVTKMFGCKLYPLEELQTFFVVPVELHKKLYELQEQFVHLNKIYSY